MFKEFAFAQKLLGVLADVQKADADESGRPDLQETIEDLVMLKGEVEVAKIANEKVIARVGRISARVGENIEDICSKLGIQAPNLLAEGEAAPEVEETA